MILQLFQQFLDVKVPQIQFIDRVPARSCASEAGTHSANCAEDRGDSEGAVDRWVDVAVIMQRQVQWGVYGGSGQIPYISFGKMLALFSPEKIWTLFQQAPRI